MEYKGKLYGKVGKTYFPLMSTTEDFDELNKKVVELSEENKKLRLQIGEYIIPCSHDFTQQDSNWMSCKKCGLVNPIA